MATAGPKRLRVLFADDERPLREFMRLELPRLGHEVTVCEDGEQAIKTLESSPFDAALLDIRMPKRTGLDVLKHIRETMPEVEVVLLTGNATVETAVESLRHGAFDFLTKPCKMTELEAVLNRIAEKLALTHKAMALESRLKAVEGTARLVGASKPMQKVKELISKVAPTDSTVLVLGETGTGKEVVARTLHEQSKRSTMPFIPVNCGALPEHLVESELFGHRKGAFTGADQNRKGLFEVADGGTLFLDEVGELPKSLQAKLLRFLESGEVRRVGENEPFRVDVRVLCATNRNLRDMVASDEFREDLFFRVNTFEIRLPSLRERVDDIPTLAEHLLSRAAKGKAMAGKITPDAVSILKAYSFPGNIRELANVMEYALIVSDGNTIEADNLPSHLQGIVPRTDIKVFNKTDLSLHEMEQVYIRQVLEESDGNKPETARKLGISLKTLYNKLNAMSDDASMAG